MPRLPQPGGDAGNWGEILNDFLEVEHQPDGKLKPDGSLASKYTKPAAGIPKSDLESGVQATLNKADASVKVTGQVSSSETGLAHGLGYTPTIVALVTHSDARVWQSSPPDNQYVYLTASTSTTVTITLEQVTPIQVAAVSVRNPTLLHLPLRENLTGTDQNGTVTATANGPVRFTSDGYFAEEGTTNLVMNPRLANNASSGWYVEQASRSNDVSVIYNGIPTFKVVSTNGSLRPSVYVTSPEGDLNTAGGEALTASFRVRSLEVGRSADLRLRTLQSVADGGGILQDVVATKAIDTDGFTVLTISIPSTASGASRWQFLFSFATTTWQLGDTMWVAGAQVEKKAYATSYCDGSMGTGYSWNGTAHASASTRAAAYVTIEPLGDRMSSFDGAIAVRVVMVTDKGTSGVTTYPSPVSAGQVGIPGRDALLFYFTAPYGNLVSEWHGDGGISRYAQRPGTLAFGTRLPIYAEWSGTSQKAGLLTDATPAAGTPRDAMTGSLVSTGSDLVIGGANSSTAMNGHIADLLIFDRPLTDAERAELAAAPEWSFDTLKTLDNLSP